MLGAKYRSAQSRDGTCAISASKDRAPISRLLKQSRDGAAPTHNDFLIDFEKVFHLVYQIILKCQ